MLKDINKGNNMTLLKDTVMDDGSIANYYLVQSILLRPSTLIATVKCELYVSEATYLAGNSPAKPEVYIDVDYSELALQSGALKSSFQTKAQAKLDAS